MISTCFSICLLLLATTTIGLLVMANFLGPTHIHQSFLSSGFINNRIWDKNVIVVKEKDWFYLNKDETQETEIILGKNLRPSEDSSSVPHYVVLGDSEVMDL